LQPFGALSQFPTTIISFVKKREKFLSSSSPQPTRSR
jgi:hypothetical protein